MGRPSAVSFAAVSDFDAEEKIGANAEPPSGQAWIALVKATAVRNVTGKISKRNDPPPDQPNCEPKKGCVDTSTLDVTNIIYLTKVACCVAPAVLSERTFDRI